MLAGCVERDRPAERGAPGAGVARGKCEAAFDHLELRLRPVRPRPVVPRSCERAGAVEVPRRPRRFDLGAPRAKTELAAGVPTSGFGRCLALPDRGERLGREDVDPERRRPHRILDALQHRAPLGLLARPQQREPEAEFGRRPLVGVARVWSGIEKRAVERRRFGRLACLVVGTGEEVAPEALSERIHSRRSAEHVEHRVPMAAARLGASEQESLFR